MNKISYMTLEIKLYDIQTNDACVLYVLRMFVM